MIVITTMEELPEFCYECPCHNGENGECDADKLKRYSLEYRPFWCPLKQVDEHELKHYLQNGGQFADMPTMQSAT